MQLQGVKHGPAFCGPGTFGFTGEGYDFHRYARWFGLTDEGLEFSAKTVTMLPRIGNMPMREDGITSREFRPRCIHVNLWNGDVVNAVGLANPGVEAILAMGRWQTITQPFSISFAMVGSLMTERLNELSAFLGIMTDHLPLFCASNKMAVQFNFGCPNKGAAKQPVTEWEIQEVITRARRLDRAIIANFSPVAPRNLIMAAAQHNGCDALWLANTIPWGHESVDWKRRYGTTKSPLTRRGFAESGGYSGRAAIRPSCETITWLRNQGIDKPIVGGNGIRYPGDVWPFAEAGADAVAVGSVVFTRTPWLRSIIREIYRCFPS